MSQEGEKVRKLLRQQAAIASFGSFALRKPELQIILNEAARICAEGLDAPFSKVCRYRDEENDLLIEAGWGWHDGVVGNVVSQADASSPQGRAFVTGQPIICHDLRLDDSFSPPAFYQSHSIISTIDIVIKGQDRPFGVLELDDDKQHDYDEYDIIFLTSFANILAEAVATSERVVQLKTMLDSTNSLMVEKERLLDQKNVMAEELKHRVRNNLHLINGMLIKQAAESSDEFSKHSTKAIARRVITLAKVYDHLIGSEMTRMTDFGGYLASLCRELSQFQDVPSDTITLNCDSPKLILDIDMITVLGIITTELVTNSYDHAFPDGTGVISVGLRQVPDAQGTGELSIVDDGCGFVPQSDSKRHGLGLVRRLSEQVAGTVSVTFHHGTAWRIRFPISPPVLAAAGESHDAPSVP